MLMMKWTSHFPGKERNEKCWKKLQTSLLSNGYKSNILKFRSVISLLGVTSERNLISDFLFVKLSCYCYLHSVGLVLPISDIWSTKTNFKRTKTLVKLSSSLNFLCWVVLVTNSWYVLAHCRCFADWG